MTYKTEQEIFWSGAFGDEYSTRNAGDFWVASNTAFFSRIFARTGKLASIIEVGANRGLNLQAIKNLLPDAELSAVEINRSAYDILLEWGGCKEVFHQSALDFKAKQPYQMAFVKGVLIHINPEFLGQIYDVLYDSSSRWLLVAEYYNPSPVEINYRGHSGKLFKRNFAGELMDRFPSLKLVDYGFIWHRDPSFPQDDITWFLLEKG